jgi:hypothetical protein
MEFVCIFYCIFELGGFLDSLFRKDSHISTFYIFSFENSYFLSA